MVLNRTLIGALGFFLATMSVGALEMRRVVDSSTPIPGTADDFFLDAVEPRSCDLGTIFVGHSEAGVGSGLFAESAGSITVLVDESTPAPDGAGALLDIDEPSCEGSRVAFSATEEANGQRGVFEWQAGVLRAIATIASELPGTVHPVTGLGSPSVSGGSTSFRGIESIVSVESLFLEVGGSVTEVADTLIVPPAQTLPFSILTAGDLGASFVFRGRFADLSSGIYQPSTGGLQVLADYSTSIAGRPGVFLRGFGVPKASGNEVAFAASTTAGGSEVFLSAQGSVWEVVPFLAPLPGGGELFSVGKVDIDSGTVAFLGVAQGEFRERLLLKREETLEEVLSTQRPFDGKTVGSFRFSLENSQLAVWVLFQDSSAAIYSGNVFSGSPLEVPALSGWALRVLCVAIAIAALFLLHSHRSALH